MMIIQMWKAVLLFSHQPKSSGGFPPVFLHGLTEIFWKILPVGCQEKFWTVSEATFADLSRLQCIAESSFSVQSHDAVSVYKPSFKADLNRFSFSTNGCFFLLLLRNSLLSFYHIYLLVLFLSFHSDFLRDSFVFFVFAQKLFGFFCSKYTLIILEIL